MSFATDQLIRKDGKGLPKDFMSKKLQTGKKTTQLWCDVHVVERDVCMLMSCVPDEDVVIKPCGKDKLVLLVVNIYNDSMGGVSQSDQMMSSYPVERKRFKKWSKKMWLHLINVCFQCSEFTQKKGGNLLLLEFCSRLISKLVEKYIYDRSYYKRRKT